MHLLLLILLLSGSAMANNVNGTFLKYSDVFTVSENGSKTIIDPSQPIISNSREFYWTGFHQRSFDLPVLCEVSSCSKKWSLGEVYFANGSQPTGIQFGCLKYEECRDFGCVPLFSWFEFAIGMALPLMTLTVLAYAGFVWKTIDEEIHTKKQNDKLLFIQHLSA